MNTGKHYYCLAFFLSVANLISVKANINKVFSLVDIKKNHVLYLLSDDHKGARKELVSQSKQLIHFLRSTNGSLIVEDPSSATDSTFSLPELCIKRNMKRSPLELLTPLAQHSDIVASNIEFRIDAVIHHSLVSVDRFVRETNDVLEEIKAYDDGPVANRFYQEIIERHINEVRPKYQRLLDRLKKKNNRLSLNIELPPEIHEVIRLYGPRAIRRFNNADHKGQVRFAITCYNKELIDARLVHAVLMHQKKGEKKTVICTGGAHIDRVFHTLLDLGYLVDIRRPAFIKDPLTLGAVLQSFCHDYDPDIELPKTEVDNLLDYCEFESDHPILTSVVPTGILCAIAGAALYLVKIYFSEGNGL